MRSSREPDLLYPDVSMENQDCGEYHEYIVSPELCPDSALWRTLDGNSQFRDDKDLKVVCGMLRRLPLAYICIRLNALPFIFT